MRSQAVRFDESFDGLSSSRQVLRLAYVARRHGSVDFPRHGVERGVHEVWGSFSAQNRWAATNHQQPFLYEAFPRLVRNPGHVLRVLHVERDLIGISQGVQVWRLDAICILGLFASPRSTRPLQLSRRNLCKSNPPPPLDRHRFVAV